MENSLTHVQKWMQEMLLNPKTSATTNTEISVHVAPSKLLSAEARLAIYQRGYQVRLLQCLEGQYKALCHALGKDLFDDFARGYLQAFPSKSGTLALLGTQFSAFLDDTRPDKDTEEKEAWVDFMVDLARFEWNLYQSFDAPGHEGREYASQTDEDHLLLLQPCFFLSTYRFPVGAYYQGVANGEDPLIPLATPQFVAISRKNYRIGISTLTAPQYSLLLFFQQYPDMEQAIINTAQTYGRTEAQVHKKWLDWKKGWINAGFFIAV